jgi:hypothetical protein
MSLDVSLLSQHLCDVRQQRLREEPHARGGRAGLLIDSIVSLFAARCLCYDVIVVFSVTRCLYFSQHLCDVREQGLREEPHAGGGGDRDAGHGPVCLHQYW